MSFTTALALALAASASAAPASSDESTSASARASVVILTPVMVRQESGLQGAASDTPSHQVARSGNIIRYVFQ